MGRACSARTSVLLLIATTVQWSNARLRAPQVAMLGIAHDGGVR